MDEVWKDIEGYEGMYLVSNHGRVMSLRRSEPHILAQGHHMGGYRQVMLSVHQQHDQPLVHRLVAKAFIPNPNGYDFVNHIDEDKANNRVDNLEWCTKSYNSLYSLDRHPERKIRYGTHFKGKGNRAGLIKHMERVQQFDKQGRLLNVFQDVVDASHQTGIKNAAIIACCKGKQKTAFGYVWRFAD